jgi:hypothetical protein
MISLEQWGLIASIGTFVVIGVTAVAALVQLSHLRVNNQLQVLLSIIRMPNEPELSSAFDFVVGDLARRLEDPAFRAELESLRPPDRHVHKELRVCDYYERLGSCIKFGLISPRLYLDNSSPDRFWKVLEPAIALYRRKRGPTAYENFEYLVVLSREWDRKYPNGAYPPRTPRLKLSDPWLADDRSDGA